jgi:hypothetical protein
MPKKHALAAPFHLQSDISVTGGKNRLASAPGVKITII